MRPNLALALTASALAAVVALAGCSEGPPDAEETVVLVHGLGRTPASMGILQNRLAGEGYRIVNFGYPSRSEPLETLTDSLANAVHECCSEPDVTFHFVTHSMGGVLVRSYLERREEPVLGRVVMLSPPNQGSEIVDAYDDSPLLSALLGPSGLRLGTDSTGIAGELGPVDFSLGIITGDRSINPIGSWLIPGPDDGKVSVSRARLEGAADFIVVHATHTFIMNRRDVAEQVAHFLADGSFSGGEQTRPYAETARTACDAPGAERWVLDLRDRMLEFDDLGLYALESFGAPLSCEGGVETEFDGLEFGSLALGFSEGAVLTVRTEPPEASVVALRAPNGFEDEDAAREVLRAYAERIGLEIDWTTPEMTTEDGETVQRFWDPDTGLNASAVLRYSSGSLVELGLSLAL